MTAMKKPRARTATTNKAPTWKTARKTSRRRSAKAGPARPLLGVGLGRVLALGLGALILGAGVAGVTWLERSNWFDRQWEQANAAFYEATVKAGLKVEDLQVTGRQRTAADVILLTTAVSRDMPILALDPDIIKARLEALIWIRSAAVERRLPNVLRITLVERQPLAIWQHEKRQSVIDQDGQIIEGIDPASFAHLPLVVGAGAPQRASELLTMLAAEPSLASRVTAAIWVSERRWNLQIDSRIKVRLPEDSPGRALADLARIEREHGVFEKDVTTIDLRQSDRLVVRTAPGSMPISQAANGEDT